jgi:hypothetical protein
MTEPFTYFHHAQAALGEERGGRFTNKALGPEAITGTEPIAAPPRISDGPWATPSGVPNEEPLGVDMTIAPGLGEPSPPAQPCSSPALAAVGERSPAAPVSPTSAARAPTIQKRRA